MSQEIAITVRDIGKCYRRNKAMKHDSVRDVIVDTLSSLIGGKKAKSNKEDFWALSGATFDIRKGENVGIIGLNGAGKSTLLKILSRIVTPTTGEARIHGRLGALLEVGTGFHQELSGRENIFLYGSILGMSRGEVEAKFDAIVEFSEIGEFLDTPVKRYSSGMYVRLAFSVAAHLDPDILLLDEVLAVGDFAFQRKCMNFARSLEQKGSTILFVSHNMFSIKTMCQRVIYLKKGKVVFDGPTDEGLKIYENDCRLAEPYWFAPDENARPIIFTEAVIEDESGAETGVVDFGKRLVFRLRYSTTRRIEAPDVRISIDRNDDMHCMTFSSLSDDISIPYLEGEGEIVLRTPPVRLTSELYLANVAVRERGHGKLLNAQVAGHFHVRHALFAPAAYGVFYEPGEWSLAPGNQVAQKERKAAAS